MSNFDVYDRSQGQDAGSPALPGSITSTSASGGAFVPCSMSFYIKAGAGGSADDVTLFSSALPAKMFVLDIGFACITAVSMSTVTLRDTSGGGGNALSTAMSSGTAGNVVRTTVIPSSAAAAASSMFLRRSDNGAAGILTITYIPTV